MHEPFEGYVGKLHGHFEKCGNSRKDWSSYSIVFDTDEKWNKKKPILVHEEEIGELAEWSKAAHC